MNLTLNKNIENKLLNKIKSQSITIDDYVNRLITKDLENKYIFNNGFYFDTHNSRLYDRDDIEVKLSKKPLMILKCLIENKDEHVSITQISKYCWNNEDTSKFTIRNMIKQIRDKTYKDIITTSKKEGYRV